MRRDFVSVKAAYPAGFNCKNNQEVRTALKYTSHTLPWHRCQKRGDDGGGCHINPGILAVEDACIFTGFSQYYGLLG